MAVSEFNSFRQPSESETATFHTSNQVLRSVEVEMQTLDALLPRLSASHGFSRPFLKLDTQGFDLEVFHGASEVRSQIVGLQSELPIKKLYEGVPSWSEALGEYDRGGFELAGLYQVNPGSDELIELDCYFVRRS
jgi:hypothetical protein